MKSLEPQNQYKNQESYNSNVDPFDEQIDDIDDKEPEKSRKRERKQKKSKKHKKKSKKHKPEKKHREQDQEQDDFQINSMFDEEAQSGEQDNEDEQFQAQAGFEQQRERYEELYKRPNATERLLERFEGKNQRQINAQYSKKAHAIRQQQQLYPGQQDPKLFVVSVRPKTEDRMVLSILNKARYLKNTSKKLTIISVISLKRKYPGKIFVQAFSQSDVRQSLQGFVNVYLGKNISKLQNQAYLSLFIKPVQQKFQFQQKSYVRVKKGLYQGDIAKILKIKKRSIDVVIVPRINIPEIKIKIKNQTDKISDQRLKQKKKQQIFRLLTDPKQKNYKQRPLKRQIFQSDFADLNDIQSVKNIRLATNSGVTNGLIIINCQPEELQKVQGTLLPVQIMPFTSDGKFIEQIKEDVSNFMTTVNFKRGQEVQIISGQLEKYYGILIDIRDKVGIIRCKNKDMKNQILQQPLVNISKKFSTGQFVKVITGAEAGKSGVILTIKQKQVQIWTQNSNSIWVNKKNVQSCNSESICTKNIHNLKKDDLIKTNKNQVGLVLQTTKDNIRILDTNNVVQVVNNIDFDQKVQIRHLVSKNSKGDEVKQGSIVFITAGINQGKRCRVVHVYKQNAFIFNEIFRRNCGIICESVDNLSIVAKNDTGKIQMSTKQGNKNDQIDDGEQIKVGMMYTIKQGSLKGYKGVVKSITNNRIQVRILSKAITEWVPRKTLVSRTEENQDARKTPNRSYKGFQPSPAFNYQD